MPSGSYFSTDMPFHRRLSEAHRLADSRREHAVAEVLLEQLDRLLGVQRPRVDQRRQDALDLDVRVEVLTDHRERVLELDQTAHRQILALDGDDHLVGGRQRVDRQQPEARRRVDEDEVVVLLDLRQRLLQAPLAADHRRHRDLRAREVDRRARDVDLALADHLANRESVHEHVVHRLLERVRVDALRHRQVALRIHVAAQHAVALLGEGHGEVERGRGLGDAALLVGERDHLGRWPCRGGSDASGKLIRACIRRRGGDSFTLGPSRCLPTHRVSDAPEHQIAVSGASRCRSLDTGASVSSARVQPA